MDTGQAHNNILEERFRMSKPRDFTKVNHLMLGLECIDREFRMV